MMKKIKDKWGVFYLIGLIIFSIYILLDTFVIPKKGVVIYNDTSSDVDKHTGIFTSNSYSDDFINISISTIVEYDTTIYIADVKISDIKYMKTAFANNTYGRNIKAPTSDIASSNNAILAINGDYYGFRNYGFVLRNGVIYRGTSNGSTALVIYNDGSFSFVDENSSNINNLLNDGAYQVLSFGPELISDNKIVVDENSEVAQAMRSNPRTAIGIIDTLHYIFVVSDGRTSESEGLSLYELSLIMKKYNCKDAYNLDGGGSSTMYFNGKVINNPTSGNSNGERKVSDIVYIGY